MVIQCNKCQKQYKVDPEKITEKGTKMTCPACGHSFIVRRKAEPPPPPPKMKTPPCKVCGQPSTHVLKGEPPLCLCERCFQIEKEKKSRFSPESFAPAPEPAAPSAPAVARKVMEEGNYFDTFDDIPDIPAESLQASLTTAMENREPNFQTDSREAAEARQESEMRDPFAREGAAAFKSQEAEPPVSAAPAPPARPAPTTEAAQEFDAAPDEDMVMEPPRPAAPPAAPASPAPVKRRPEPAPAGGRFSLDEEVESSLEQEKARPVETARESPLGGASSRQTRKHWPAYVVSIGVIVLVVLAAGYFLIQQGGKGTGSGEPATALAPSPVAPAPVPGSLPEVLPSTANSPPALSPMMEAQVSEKLKLFREFFLRDTIEGYQKAIKELDQALALAPQNAQAESLRIETHAFLASLADSFLYTRSAKRLIEKASMEVRQEPAYKRSRIQLFLVEGDARAARMELQDYLAQRPEDGIGYYLLGVSYLKDKPSDFGLAKENFEKALSFEPGLVRVYWDLGNLYRARRQLQEAADAFRQVLKLSPQKTEAADALSEVEADIKKKAVAAAPTATPVPTTLPAPTSTPVTTPAPGATATPAALPGQPIALPGQVLEAAKTPPAPATGLAASGDALADNLREIISEVSKPMSRVPQAPKPAEPAAPPPVPDELIPPEERPQK